MRTYGLIGKNLTNTFSKIYFKNKFKKEHITNSQYLDFEIQSISDFKELLKNKKISGILIETVDLGGKVGVVIGIGINVHMTKEEGRDIDQSWISLDQVTDSINNRNEVVANLLNELFNLTISFSQEGFRPFKDDFENLDLLKGKMCNISLDGQNKVVEVMGVNDNGELIVKDNSENLTLRYGEVSIREL